jgi:multidrug efflux pump
MITIFGAPAVPGLGRAGGIKLMVQDRGDVGMKTLQEQTANLLEKGNQQPSLVGLFSSLRTASPQIRVEVNPAACAAEGVAPLDVSTTLSATLGARYVNDFNRFGRTWQVNVQASPKYRDRMEDIRRLKVRNTKGELVPIGTLANITTKTGPLVVSRYNMYPAAAIQGNVAPGASSGYAISVLEQLAESELRSSMGYEWTELTFIELRSRDTGIFVFLISVFVVFLVLAALYESWALPMAVILVVPLCVLSSLVGVWFAQLEINIFTQVGFVVLIGLACKNAILIVEYARQLRLQGTERRKAVLAACRQRLRPILMTSVAFILGVVPLAFSSGAGSEMRGALGIAVFAGMIGVTFFGIFLTPVFYVVIDRIVEGRFGQSRFVRSTGRWLQFLFAFGWLRAAIRSMPIVLEKVKKLRTSKSG